MGNPPEQKDEGAGLLRIFKTLESMFLQMIVGIFRLPGWLCELLHNFFGWLECFLHYAVRCGIRLARVLFFAAIWGLLVFGPLAAAMSLHSPTGKALGIAWAVICLFGSVWGLNRWWKQRSAGRLIAVLLVLGACGFAAWLMVG